jgi:diguanylate cyclase (GGDEF)-like protein/PAS domain S-box-containing protein
MIVPVIPSFRLGSPTIRDMQFPPRRLDEAQAVAVLRDLQVMDSAPEIEFQALVEVASMVCEVPISLITLIDDKRQWFKANVGLTGATEGPRDVGFCAHVVLGDGVFEIPDTVADERFADNPLVTADGGVRFYAGAPVVSGGQRIGTVCVIDHKPKTLTRTQRRVLQELAIAAGRSLEGRAAMLNLQQSSRDLQEAQRLGRIGSWEWDLATNSSTWSDELYRITGRDPALLAPTLEERLGAFLPGSREKLAAALRNCRETGEPYALELEFARLSDQQSCWLDARGAAVRNDQGDIVALRGTAQDISTQKQSEQALRKSQAFLERTGELAGVGGWEVDFPGAAVTWSAALCDIHGTERGFRPALTEALAFYEPKSRPLVEAAVQNALETGASFDLEVEIVTRQGALRDVRVVGSVERQDGSAVRLSGAFQDITQRKRLAQELAEQLALMRVTLHSIADAVITTDDEGLVTWLNPVAERLTGWQKQEAIGKPLGETFHVLNQDTRELEPHPLVSTLTNGRPGKKHRSLLVARDGKEWGIEESAAPIRSESGELLGMVLVFRDVSEQRRQSSLLAHRAAHDALTGLVNRTEFDLRLERTLAQTQESGFDHVLLYIDLDRFKRVNDSCGHAAGDELLRQVSRLLKDTVRSRDTLARLGGDEFAVLLTHCTTRQAFRVAQNLCDRVAAYRFLHDGLQFDIGASIGLAPFDKRWSDIEQPKHAADAACYAAKREGRNRVHEWRESDGIEI